MLTVPPAKLDERWDALPETLRAALVSQENTLLLRQTCESEHIVPDKTRQISGATGLVIMGFLHPEELAKEIQDRTNIDGKVASSLADAINLKIIRPLEEQINAVYAPVPSGLSYTGIAADIQKPILAPSSSPQRIFPQNPAESSQVRMGEPPTPPKPGLASTPKVPAPVIIHEESKPDTVKQAPTIGFGGEVNIKDVKLEKTAPPKPAFIEIGKAQRPAPPPQPPKKEPAAPRVVDYSEFAAQIKKQEPTPSAPPPPIPKAQPTPMPPKPATPPPSRPPIPTATFSEGVKIGAPPSPPQPGTPSPKPNEMTKPPVTPAPKPKEKIEPPKIIPPAPVKGMTIDLRSPTPKETSASPDAGKVMPPAPTNMQTPKTSPPSPPAPPLPPQR